MPVLPSLAYAQLSRKTLFTAFSTTTSRPPSSPTEVACAYCFGLKSLLQRLDTLASALHQFVARSGSVAYAALYFVAFHIQCDSFFE